ncbi:hypothetical protein COHA_002996 [Chlorella ohadii]|uniref:Uncharacterized protein n=1 Tax=Chlorella ohadii TaxID=2649997 RepID=A0AAD5DVQ7_9CHLO|nr:hypothetical protein COHA_002996 [Chlorella ohadii]
MRRGAKALVARALLVSSGTASTALPAAATGALAALQGAVPLPPQPPLPPPAGWRPFTCGTALFDAQQQDYEDEPEQQHHEGGWRRYPQRRRHGGPPPDSPLGRLAACRTVEDMRAWKESLGDAFQAPELGSAVRALFTSDGRGGRGKGSKPGSQDYMRELLTLAADGQVALDGKAAAYLVWGAAKAQLRGSDPSVQRIMPLVFEHIDSMRANDMSSLVWAMGLLGIRPSAEQRALLHDRLLPLLPEEEEGAMRMRELTATAVEATRLIKVLPHLPGLEPSSPLSLAVFDCLLTNAHSPGTKLHSLADMAFAAGKMGCCFDGADVERLVGCAQEKLGQNYGPQVHTLLHGLGLMGLRASDRGPVTHEFVLDCVDSQLGTAQQPQHLARLIGAVGVLRAAVPEDRLQRVLDELSAAGLDSLPEWQARMALIGFRRLRFQPGAEALEPFVQFKKQQHEQQDVQAQQEEATEEQQQ